MPKQYHRLFGNETLLQSTWRRARLMAPPARLFAVAPAAQGSVLRAQLTELLPGHLLVEPEGRDTLPCLVRALSQLGAEGDGPILVLPADHWVGNPERLVELVWGALPAADEAIVLFGVEPTRPETGYGYVEVEGPKAYGRPAPVMGFHEKPEPEAAMAFLTSGRFLWNSGMFLMRPSVFLAEVRAHAPDYLAAAEGDEAFVSLPRLSVDKGLLERTRRLVVVPSDLLWDDVGSWESLLRLLPRDEGGNVLVGPAVAMEAKDSLLLANGRTMVAFGVERLLVVDSEDVLLVADRRKAADMKELTAALKARGAGALLDRTSPSPLPEPAASTVVDKPWGREIWWARGGGYAAKLLVVRAGEALSLQYHREKEETLWVVRGSGILTVGAEERSVAGGHVVHIPPGTLHRLEAATELWVVEVSTDHLDDVVRVDDRYGRQEARDGRDGVP